MLALFLILVQPIPASAVTPAPESRRVSVVDVVVINQFIQRIDSKTNGVVSVRYVTKWYSSFWTIHYFPPCGTALCRVAVWRHRGWQRFQPPVPCSDGWAVDHNTITIVAARLLLVVSDYDFEYGNRRWMSPLP